MSLPARRRGLAAVAASREYWELGRFSKAHAREAD
jgi:hypothetical protein